MDFPISPVGGRPRTHHRHPYLEVRHATLHHAKARGRRARRDGLGVLRRQRAEAPGTGEPSGPELSVVTFGVTRIGTADESILAWGINDLGQVAGTLQFGSSSPRPFLWTNGTKQVFFDGGFGFANDVNSTGLVVGQVASSSGPGGDAAAWESGALTRLAAFYSGGSPTAQEVNSQGRIIGTDVVIGSPQVGLVWSDKSDATPTRVAGPSGLLIRLQDISDADVIVGSVFTPGPTFSSQAVVWSDEHASPLTLTSFEGGPCAGNFPSAQSVNERGEIVGHCEKADGRAHGAYWADKDAIPVDLGPGAALSINELGQIGGDIGDDACRASLWLPGAGGFRQFDLGIPDGIGFVRPVDLNNSGQVLGNGLVALDQWASVVWTIPIQVALDVVPKGPTNLIKLDGKGQVTAAILGSRWFRAADVDPASLTLGNDDGLETPIARRKGSPSAKVTDVNRDGFDDLTADFDEAALMNNGDLAAGTTSLVLLGRLGNGKQIRGADRVQVQ